MTVTAPATPLAGIRDELKASFRLDGGLAAAALLVLASRLPWVAGPPSASGFKVPSKILFKLHAQAGGTKIGHLLLAFAVFAVVASLRVVPEVARRVIGAAVLLLCAVYVLQLQRLVGSIESLKILGTIGFGVYLAAVSGVMLVLAGLMPRIASSASKSP